MVRRSHRPWIWIAGLVLVVGWGSVHPVPAIAQEADTRADEASPPEEPKEITTADFALEASAVEERLSRIKAQISLIDVIDEVKEELGKIETAGLVLEGEFKGIEERRAMRTELNTLSLRLEAQDARIDIQIEKLSDYADGLEELAGQNSKDVEVWRRAFRDARKASFPKTVRDRTGSILQGLREGQNKLEQKQLEVLAVQTRALDVRDAIHIAQQKVAIAQRAQVESVFERQDPPFWAGRVDSDEALGRPGYRVRFSWSALRSYVDDHSEVLILQLVLVLALGWLLVRMRALLRARSDKRQEREGAPWEQQAAEALRHPWTAALLLGIASIRVFGFERAVDQILILWAVALPLWFVVFKELVPPKLHKALAGIALLGVLHIVVALVSDNSRVERILLLVELVLACVGFAWLIRYLRITDAPQRVREGLWFTLTSLWLRFAFLVSVSGVVASLLGYRYLATDAAMVAVIGTIAATAWPAIARIVEAVVAVAVHAGKLDAFRMVRGNRDVIARTSSRVIRLVAAGLFFWSLADMTSAWRPIGHPFRRLLEIDLGLGFTDLGLTLGDLLAFFVVLGFGWLVARFVSFVMHEEVFPRLRVKEGVPYALTTFTRYAIITIAFIAAVSVLGVPLDRVTIVLSALGVGIGFGLQNLVSNVVSGFVLLTERPIRVRDKIQIDDVLGNVSHIGIRASTVRTFDGAEVIIPNDDLISGRVINFTLSERHQRVIIPVGVAYGTDPKQVLGILRKLAADHEGVFKSPAPLALFRGFGDSSLDFELRVFMDPSDVLEVPSELAVAINDALKEAGIEIPFPQRDLHLRSVAAGIIATGTDAEPAGGTDAGAGTHARTGTHARAGTDASAGSDAGSGARAGTHARTDASAGSDAGPGADTDSERERTPDPTARDGVSS